MSDVKTMAGWEEFAISHPAKNDWDDYCRPGDSIDREVYDYFLNILPPATMHGGYFQAGGAVDDRKDPKNGRYRATYGTFAQEGPNHYVYLGNCFKGEHEATDFWIDFGSVEEFLAQTERRGIDGWQRSRPHIRCQDGFSLSVQAGKQFYSRPKMDIHGGNYTHVEIGRLSAEEPMLLPYAENTRNPKKSIYAFVPIDIVETVIRKHGGFFESRLPGAIAWRKSDQTETALR